ncbi:YgiT-type zinc finger protein [candidate division KSB1 bacterium]|nr:YgiT-type zinc finger protein [candidate division KSB1 bacterium]
MRKNKNGRNSGDRCDRCYEGTLHPQKVSETILKRGRALVIDDIPAEVCSRCGYRYFDIKVIRAMDALFGEYAVHIDLPKIVFQEAIALQRAA